jgi:hypothetical protein
MVRHADKAPSQNPTIAPSNPMQTMGATLSRNAQAVNGGFVARVGGARPTQDQCDSKFSS